MGKGCALLFGAGCGILVFVAFILWLSTDGEGRRTPRYSDPELAFTVCKEFGKQAASRELASPQWPRGVPEIADTVGVNTYRVRTHLFANNAFGSRVRVAMNCQVVKTGGEWRLEELTLE